MGATDDIENAHQAALDNALVKLSAATALRDTEIYSSIVSAPERVTHLLLSGILEVMLADSGRYLNSPL